MAAKTSGRTPLMAGNWKMNLDHLQATHLVQKLDWTLRDGRHDFGAVEVAVLPPFTDLRSVQTLIDGDRLELRHGAQDLSTHDSGAYTGEISGAFLAKLGCTYVAGRATASVASTTASATTRSTPRSRRPTGTGSPRSSASASRCTSASRSEHVAYVLAQVEACLAGVSAEQAEDDRGRLRAGLGHRHG